MGGLRIETTRFGPVEASEEEILSFPGLPGFPDARRFVVRGHDRGWELGWLISMDVPELAFVVTDPYQFFPDYAPALDDELLRGLEVQAAEELAVLVIASVREGDVTLNLAAPLVINSRTRAGVQLILDQSNYPTRAALPALEEEKQA